MLTGSLLTRFSDADSHRVHAFLALLHAPYPACGQLLELVIPAHARLSGATACAAVGRAGRALLNGFPAQPATAVLRAPLPCLDFTGTDSLMALALPIRLVIDAVVQVPPDGIANAGALFDPMRLVAVQAELPRPTGTVQHDGMEYRRIASLPPWPFPTHTRKGWLPDPQAPARQDEAAVTGACLAARRADLLALGGLDEELIIADFEDAALCEALRARSLRIVLRRDVQLHHLERQTPGSDTPWRFGATLANASHFAARWNPDAG